MKLGFNINSGLSLNPGLSKNLGLSIKRGLLLLSWCLLWQLSESVALAADHDLVLVVSSASSIVNPLKAAEVRKIYLGISMFNEGQPIKPLLNYSDNYLQEVFMQKVMFLSTPAYERQILSRVFRMGGTRPPVYAEIKNLLGALKDDPDTITYMYRDEATAHPELKIVNTLWEQQD